MDRFQGLIGIVLILMIAFLFSNNKKRINYRLVISGLALQLTIGILILKIPAITRFFQILGKGMGKIEEFARQGAAFVYGGVAAMGPAGATDFTNGGFVFAFNVTATIILVCVLVALFYHFGIMQRIISVIAKAMNFIMRVSGAEALSNVASAFVGQVEAQVMIRPYLPTMTKSEILASMSGSLACIAGGILVVYANMGAQAGMDLAPKLITASLMAAPGALVIAKILFPETEVSQTMGKVTLEVKSQYSNTIDAITHGAGDGFKIAMNVIAMLIGFIALIALVDLGLGHIGAWINYPELSMNTILGKVFSVFAFAMGVPAQDVEVAGALMGKKMVVNEFVAYLDMVHLKATLDPKTIAITSFALCGFANFASIGIQVGGIGIIAPKTRKMLTELGFKAMIAGSIVSLMSATIAGIILG